MVLFLRMCVLCVVILMFRNDVNGDFGKWATNSLVLWMFLEM